VIVIPVYILAILASCSFLIPANEGERIGYIITIHLAIVFIMNMVEDKAAPSGDFPRPKLLGMISFVNFLSLFSFLEVCTIFDKFLDNFSSQVSQQTSYTNF